MENKRDRRLCLWLGLIVILFALLGIQQVYSIAIIQGESMEPTLWDWDIVPMVSAKITPIQRGDVVIVIPPCDAEQLFIKRVVGMPGEIIRSDEDTVYINDEPLETVWGTGSWGPIQIPLDAVFCMGDNRAYSNDSRSFGVVPLEDVVKHARIEQQYWENWKGGAVMKNSWFSLHTFTTIFE